MTTAYPLTWPPTIPRSKARERGAFKTTLAGALKNVRDSLQRFANDSGKSVGSIVLSSNVTLGQERPSDPGVAVWFTWDGMQVCIPVDRYQTPEANLQAIHHIIEARRVELRHGTLALVRASFTGFLALPGPSLPPWRAIFGFSETAKLTREHIDHRYRAMANELHPDKGGTDEAMAKLNRAREDAMREITA